MLTAMLLSAGCVSVLWLGLVLHLARHWERQRMAWLTTVRAAEADRDRWRDLAHSSGRTDAALENLLQLLGPYEVPENDEPGAWGVG